jgi:general secretion pathway protein D
VPQPVNPVPIVAPQVEAAPPVVAAAPTAPAVAEVTRGSLNIAAPAAVELGKQFKIEIKISDVQGVAKAPFVLLFDPIFVDFVGAAEGSFLNRDGKKVTFSAVPDKGAGRVTVTMARPGDAGGLDGSGTLMTATFTAKNKGPASLGFQSVKFADQTGKILEMIPYNTVVEVR